MRIEDLNELMDEHNIPLKTWEQDDFTGRDWGGHGAMIARRLNAFPELLERCAFLERVAEQAVGFAVIDYMPEKEVETDYGTIEQLGDGIECNHCRLRGGCEEYPDLAAYLRSKSASDAGQDYTENDFLADAHEMKETGL